MRGFSGMAIGCVVWIAVALALVGCQTTSTGRDLSVSQKPRVVVFAPSNPGSGLHLDKGRYPDLFAPGSTARWVDGNGGSRADAMASALGKEYVVIECRLESAFSDMSKAYEAVGMRGIDVVLLSPTGAKLRPVKKLIGEELEESAEGALRRFSRTNILVFDRGPLNATVSGNPQEPPEARLVLSGYGSTFYFAWHSLVPAPAAEKHPEFRTNMRKARARLEGVPEGFMRLSHRFD